jgi:hypothetical protein
VRVRGREWVKGRINCGIGKQWILEKEKDGE